MFIVSGILLWIIGDLGNHIGASGIVYGNKLPLLERVIRSNLLLMRISLVVVFLYGGMIWWMLPIKEESAGKIPQRSSNGLILAIFYRNSGPKRYYL